MSMRIATYNVNGINGRLVAKFLFGGSRYGDGTLEMPKLPAGTLMVDGAVSPAVAYLNVVLDTASLPEADTNYPSWGTCKVKKVIPNEPLGIIAARNT
jgi:hypothetical protein